MLFSAVAILCLAPVFTGVGLLFPWAQYPKDPRFEHLLAGFWTGWALAIAFLQIWHLFFPVGLAAFLAILLASIAGWLRARRAAREHLGRTDRRLALLLAALVLVPALILANHVMYIPAHYDHGLYHQQTVKWISNYAIVPGLGNLHHRLAFNNATMLYTTAINAGPLAGRAFYLSNTLLAWVAILQCAAGLFRILQGEPATNTRLFYAVFLPIVILHAGTTHLAGYSVDPPVFIIQVVLAGETLRLFELGSERGPVLRQAALIVLLAAAGVSAKLSFAVFGALTITAAALAARSVLKLSWPEAFRAWAGWVGLAAVWIVPWLARHVLLSGYLVYPSAALPLPVPWRIPEDLAAAVPIVITAWARQISPDIPYTGDLAWFLRWWDAFYFTARQALVFTLGIAAFDLLLALGLRRRCAVGPGPLTVALIALAGLVFWFVMGPDYRFSGAVIWILLAAALVAGIRLLSATWVGQKPHVLAVVVILALTAWLSPNHFSNNLSLSRLFLPPPESELAEQAQPMAGVTQQVTGSGLVVYTPPGDQEQCWNLPLPCTTPHDYTPRLYLLQPGEMQKGFAYDGDD